MRKTLNEISAVASRVPAREDGAPAHALLATRPEKNVVLIVVSGDKGLAGGFNTNVNRAAGAFLRDAREKGIETVSLLVLGKKANDFWKRRSVPILDARPGLFAKFDSGTAAGFAKALAEKFIAGEIDAVYVVSNEFKSVLSQVVVTKKLLPLSLESQPATDGADYLYEPAPEVILRTLLPRALDFAMYRATSRIERGLLLAAQMTAMAARSRTRARSTATLTITRARASRKSSHCPGAAALE